MEQQDSLQRPSAAPARTKARVTKRGKAGSRVRKPASRVIPAAPAPSSDSDHPGTGTALNESAVEYLVDSLQRSVLFMDALRERGDAFLEHERQGLPPLLHFRYETLLDARHFERPANYALLRIVEIGDDCWEDCVDPHKPPVMIVDPRAGHGPGIGGFKRDSEVGMALHEGHPVYFVIFYPEPMRGQTIADVQHALRAFVEEVQRRHPGHTPILYGNCQAGWALTLLAADCEGLTGPVVLNGSPLSYWAGEPGTNPMRVSGGLLGGAWLANLVADLGDGRFDGAWLAQNFENLKPEKAIWEKYATLFHAIDSERDRFLEFERWWNGFYSLSREEIVAIVENLFIGNRLERGEIRLCDGCTIDLRRMRNPLVVFASQGDNITPPHQALGWIPALYRDSADLKRAGQRIVYLINPHVGHLGIFVSASVARLEHRAIFESLDDIERLEPGLYEMKIDNPTGDPDCRKPQYAVRFEAREVADLPSSREPEAFERMQAISEFNESVYRTFVSPWVQALTNPWVAQTMKWLHPMRARCYLFSEAFNPWMAGVRTLAESLRRERQTLPDDHPWLEQERAAIERSADVIEYWRQVRDTGYQQAFAMMYGAGTASTGEATRDER